MFGKNLKHYRLKNRMSKKELATAIVVSPVSITHYENGSRKSELSTIKKLGALLNLSILDFIAIQI